MNTSIPLQEVKELLGDYDCIYFETGVMTFCITTLVGGKRRTVWAYKDKSGNTTYEGYKEFTDSVNVDEMSGYVYDQIKDFIAKPYFHGVRDTKAIEVPF